jgi:hypothetical protein
MMVEQPSVNTARIETLLSQGQVVAVQGVLRWASNYATLVTVADSELQVAAIYKPQRGERPLWDFPERTLCYREVVSYWVSQALGWELVPPTVLREGPQGLGSCQLFVPHDPEINYFSLDDRFVPQLQRYALFDYVINNADRKGGHLLLDANGKLWGIDHGLTFHTIPKLRTVIWEFEGQPVEADLLTAVQAFYEQVQGDQETRRKIETLLSQKEIDALLRRTQHLLENKTYPQPGPGMNTPWPPI